MHKLSVIIPIYYNEENLIPLYTDLREKLIDKADFNCEIIMVDDGSGDNSWRVIQELAAEDARIVPIHLSRNFGSHAAMLCGLSCSTGDCAVIKAADLQEPTELILEMYHAWLQGNNVVLGVRADREDKSLFSDLYYWLVRKTSLKNMPPHGFDVFLLDRKVIHVLEELDENNSAITCQILWSGFRTKHVYYTRRARKIGKSKWTLGKRIRLVMDTLFSFSNVPINVITGIGVACCCGSALWALAVLIGKFNGMIQVAGYTTLLIFQLFSFGVVMLTLGLLGNYIWRTFDASRNRPVYIIEEEGGARSEEWSHCAVDGGDDQE